MSESTGTDIALPSEQRQNASTEVASRPPERMSDLVSWAFDASQAHRIAVSLAETDFVPKAMKHKPDEVTGAILTGYELGLKPMAALRSIDIIQGTPAVRANTMRALVQSAGHTIIVVETDDQKCTIKGRRSTDPDGEWTTVTWTWARAVRAGLTSKDTWNNYPEEMLLARATGQLCRLIAADLILGIPYTAEEVRDMDGAPPTVTRVTLAEMAGQDAPAPPTTAAEPIPEPTMPSPEPEPAEQPTATPEPTAEPEHGPAGGAYAERVTDEPVEATVDPDAPATGRPFVDPMEPMIRPRQTGAIHALATKLGLDFKGPDRIDYLAELSATVGWDVTSSKELTAVEAGKVIERWQAKVDSAPRDDGGQR